MTAVFYRVTMRPWLWLATLNCENRIFQNQNVVEITESILKDERYPFSYDLRLVGLGFGVGYPKRDYVRQMWESDFAFLSRLWREWGLYFFMEGSTLVLCDSPGSHKPHGNMYDSIPYHAPDGKHIDEEHIHKLAISRELTTGAVSLVDHDYTRSRASFRATQNDGNDISFANAEYYGWGDYSQPLANTMGLSGEANDYRREAEHLARVRLDAVRCRSQRARGTGNLRGLATGRMFALRNHPLKKANIEYLVVSTDIDIRNNAETSRPSGAGAQYLCVTDFVLQPANTFFKNRLGIKKPQCDSETAVVVGPDKKVMWVDGYARVKVQFIWDRLGKNDENSSCWVRVSSPWQGNNFGVIYLPRIGQEVTVNYHEGDPDKPYVSSRQVNQFNQPPWKLPANQALSGLGSKEIDGEMANQFVADDTTGKSQVQVSSDYAQSRLVLGYNTRIAGNDGRKEARGIGWELATDMWGVARAAQGLLITTEPRAGAQAPVKDMGETVQRLIEAHNIHESLSDRALQNEAQDADSDQSNVTKVLKAQNDAIRGQAKTDDNSFPEFAQPHLTLASPSGIQTTTAGSTQIASSEHLALTTGEHIGIAAGKSLLASVRERISLFAELLGIRLIAAAGKIRIEAHSDSIQIIAKQVVELISATDWINLNAKQGIRLNGGGTELEISARGILGFTEGKFLVHADSHATDGPVGLAGDLSAVAPRICLECLAHAAKVGASTVARS